MIFTFFSITTVMDNLEQNKKAPLVIFTVLLTTFFRVTADYHYF